MIKTATTTTLLALALILGCDGGGTIVDPPYGDDEVGVTEKEFSNGDGALRGHEDILRIGIEHGNALIAAESGIAGMFTPVPFGDACPSTSHVLLKGDCVTDNPDATMSAFYGVSDADWDYAPLLQDLHFMRNYVGSYGAESARLACWGARERITVATEKAMGYWQAGDRVAADYWLGHALHIVQDSFAKSHARRTGTNLRTLTDVCTYGRIVWGACYHLTYDPTDLIWRRDSWSCAFDPNVRTYECMTDQARGAVRASAGFLRTIGRYVVSGFTANLDLLLDQYFEAGATDNWNDYFHCSQLR